MTDYIHEPALVADPFTFARAANASIAVYDADDTFNAVPLVLKDLNGLPMDNPVTSTGDAVTPWMITTSAQLKLVGGGLTVVVSSYKGLREDALRAQAEAQEAKTAARDAQAEAEAAKDAAVAAAGLVGAPSDVAISTAINAPGSATRAALHATYVPKVAGWDDAASDAVNSWHTVPRSVYDELRDRVYQGVVSENGTIGITVHDRRRRTSDRVNLGQFEVDDHNPPAFLFREGKDPLSAVARHAVEPFVRVRRGAGSHNYKSLATASELQVAFPAEVTYAHWTDRPNTNTVALGTRNADGWYMARSTNWGTAFGAAFKFHNKAYCTHKQAGNALQYTIYDHPITTPNGSVYYFNVDRPSGDVKNAAGSVAANNWWTMASAIPTSSMTLVTQLYDTDTPYNTVRVLDIANDGSILAVQFNKNAPELGGMYGVYRFAVTDNWVFEPIVHTGKPVGYFQSGYFSGAGFGATSNEVFLGRESVGTWSMERRVKDSASWVLTHTIATRTDGAKLGRPQVPWGSEGKGILAAIEYFRYPEDSFTGYYGDQLIFNTNIVNPVIPDTTPPAVPTGLSATGDQLSAVLSWSDVADAVGYRVYQGASLKATVQAAAVTITGLLEGTPYTFHVSAFDAAGNESAKASFVPVTPTSRILTPDELLPDGTLILIDPTHSLGAWPAGVPTTTVTNLARDKALATVGSGVASDYDFTVSNTLTATDGAVSRTSKGGLAVIASQATAVQNRNYTLLNEKVRAYLAANTSHSYFISVWATPTRLSLEATPGTLQRYAGYLSGASSDTISARLASGNKLTVAPSANRIGVKESASPAPVGTAINVHGGHASIPAPGADATFVMMGTANVASAVNKAPSWVMYHIRLEDLTASGRTYAQAAEIDQIEFDQAFKAGGRLSGDTYTAVSTLP